jgi:MoxR-like ATPase
VISQVVLADEINRATPRTQSALLEAMQEHQVTVDGTSYKLPRPYLVLATQNPIELEGTFPLPEAQLDRFLIRIKIGYPTESEEDRILLRFGSEDPLDKLGAVSSPEEIILLQQVRKEVRVEDSIRGYIVAITRATRQHPEIDLGASPRATLALFQISQAWAAIHNRSFVLPDDVKAMAPHILAHRLIITPQAQLRGRNIHDLIEGIIGSIPVPVEE